MRQMVVRRRWLAGLVAAAVISIAAVGCSGAASDAPTTIANGVVNGLPTGSERISTGQPQAFPILPSVSTANGVQQTGIWVAGSATIEVPADTGVISLGVESREETVTAARQAAAEAMTAVVDEIKALGIAEDDIVTTSFNIRPEQVWVEVTDSIGRHSEPRIIGYIVTNTVTVTVRDIDQVAEVVDTAANEGGDLIRINSISFTVDDTAPHAAEIRTLAAEDARAKAQLYADALGVTLGQAVFVQEMGSSVPTVRQTAYAEAAVAADGAFAPTPISSGDVSLSASVQVAFAITQ